jgi:hypothetical protein
MKAELFEAVYNLANGTYTPTEGRTMGATTAKIDRQINEPKGDTADEILKNVRDEAAELVARADIPDSSKPQVVTQVLFDKINRSGNEKFQAAILDTVVESKKKFFDKLLEDCCAGDFAGFVPEKIIGDEKKKQDDGNASCC